MKSSGLNRNSCSIHTHTHSAQSDSISYCYVLSYTNLPTKDAAAWAVEEAVGNYLMDVVAVV
jgi:hypothetical protein